MNRKGIAGKGATELSYGEIKKAVLAGKVFVYPTDTLYGIGGNALDEKVVERIYKIKKREGRKPLSVIMGNLEMVREYCEIDERQMAIVLNYLPGPHTFILKLKKGKKIPAAAGSDKIGVRVPEHVFARKLSADLGVPIVSTSANISGGKDAVRVAEVDKTVVRAVDFVVDMGETMYKQGSTVVDLTAGGTSGGKVLRKGAGEFPDNW